MRVIRCRRQIPALLRARRGTTESSAAGRLTAVGRKLSLWRGAATTLTITTFATALVVAGASDAAAVNDIPTVISNTRSWIVGILAGLATLFLTVGGVRYLMAGGDPGEVEKAKTALKAAAIGYVLAILAPIILDVLNGIVGDSGAPAAPTAPAPAGGPV